MKAKDLRKKAIFYNKKKIRKRIINFYKAIKKGIKFKAKNGKYEWTSKYINIYNDWEAFVAVRLFTIKHPDFNYKYKLCFYNEDRTTKNVNHVPFNHNEHNTEFYITITW